MIITVMLLWAALLACAVLLHYLAKAVSYNLETMRLLREAIVATNERVDGLEKRWDAMERFFKGVSTKLMADHESQERNRN